jgi:G2/mitotic-specific cyclin 3/4
MIAVFPLPATRPRTAKNMDITDKKERGRQETDTSIFAEYSDEIFKYMRSIEEQLKPNASYMDFRTQTIWPMRPLMIGRLIEIHDTFNLSPETLFLAVNYFDRFLLCNLVSLEKLQLVGATALFIAARYKGNTFVSAQDIVKATKSTYTVDDLIKAESFMLHALEFKLEWPCPLSFLRRIGKVDSNDDHSETITVSMYFLEITAMDKRFFNCVPSFLSAGSYCLARFMLKKHNWVF